MSNEIRRSTRSRSSLNVKFADDPDYDEHAFEDDQGDDDIIDELPVARVKQEHQRHTSQNINTNSSSIIKRRRGRPAKRESLHDNDEDWHVEDEEEFSTGAPVNVTLSPQANSSVYEFSETSNRKSIGSSGNNISRDSAKTPNKIRRDEKHLCPYCNYCTGKKYLLQRHLKSHSTERPHKCTYCSNTFKTTAQLQNHVNTHLGIKPFQCKFCEYKFTTSGELIRHVRYKHTMEKPHKCEECGYATVELSKLRRHIRTHTGVTFFEKPYSCPHCSYCSPDTFKLKRHLRVHTGERPYQCTVCKFRFTQSNSLKAHMLTHQTNAQKFHCTYCPTVLTRKADLKQHMIKKHANDEDFVTCLKCDQEFADPLELNQHKKIHHENAHSFNVPRVQLSCTLCSYKTFSQNMLDEHMNSQHRDHRTFQCNECGLMYATRGDLRQHVTKVHRCGVYAKIPAGGLSIRPRTYSASLKNSQRSSSTSSLSPMKQQMSHRETIYRCALCSSKFTHLRAIERHHYDAHHIDPFDAEAMKNATIQDEEEIEDEQNEDDSITNIQSDMQQQDMYNRDEDEQMAIIQFRNQHHNAEQSPLIVKIERDGNDNFETADDYLTSKPTPRARQLQKARRTLSKTSFDNSTYVDSSATKREHLHNSNYEMKGHYDDYMDIDHELETGDTLVENIGDDDDNMNDEENLIIKYRSSTQKTNSF